MGGGGIQWGKKRKLNASRVWANDLQTDAVYRTLGFCDTYSWKLLLQSTDWAEWHH